ncbi:MAG: carboxypeptidase-like regulatory domain-containing protein [Candidatus Eisenbacteria bacterium]
MIDTFQVRAGRMMTARARGILILGFALVLVGPWGCGVGPECDSWTVEGHVRDLSGDPIENARIAADINPREVECCPSDLPCLCGFEEDTHATTDAQGYYRLWLGSADTAAVLVIEESGYRWSRWFHRCHREHGEAETQNVDFLGYSGQFISIRGSVRDALIRPLVGIELELRDTGGYWHDHARSDSNGDYAFEMTVPGFTYTLRPYGGECAFDPPEIVYENLTTDQGAQDFHWSCGE